MKKTILVVDDDAEITDLIEVYLCNEGFGVIKCYDGLQAQNVLESNEISLAIVDVMMPQMNGFDLCRKIREQFSFPIIILTARFEFTDKINGLSIGADDYMVKPFHPLELIARVKAQLRRAEIYNVTNKEKAPEHEISYRGITMNRLTHKCIFNNTELVLTPTEFDILWMLCARPYQVISSEEIFEHIWKEKYYTGNKTVMVHIRHIRDKMHEPPGNPDYIKTVWGVGYKIE
ncbi:MAG: response regulator transcription factor [Oscillospiraceae bacterium]|nr:response regulator transcription factor [Oscillospiraceae bacterium]